MKKKINLKVLLVILLVVLLVLLLIFFFTREKPEEEKGMTKYNVEKILSSDELYFYNNNYTYWETSLLDYLTVNLGYSPSLRESVLNDNGDLVITYKNYDSKSKDVVLVEVFTISRVDGSIVDSKGNSIDLAQFQKNQALNSEES